MNGLPLAVVSVLMEDCNDLPMLRRYNASCGHYLQVCNLVVADPLNINWRLIGNGNDTNVITDNTTVRATIDDSQTSNTFSFRVRVRVVCISFSHRKKHLGVKEQK